MASLDAVVAALALAVVKYKLVEPSSSASVSVPDRFTCEAEAAVTPTHDEFVPSF